MKKLFTSLVLSVITSFGVNAQLNNFSVGQAAPDFTVTDIHGHTHTLSDYAGKWVVLDFFFTTCGPCQAVSPTINEFYKKYGCNNYDIIVLAIETTVGNAQTQVYEDTYGGDANYPTPAASGTEGGGEAVAQTYGPAAYPTVVLIGPDGLFKNIDIWPIANVAAIESALTTAGAQSALVVNSCSAASIEENTLLEASVAPNPTNTTTTIRFAATTTETAIVNLYSVSGQLISSTTHQVVSGSNAVELDLTSLEVGTYFVKINSTEAVSKMIPVVKK